MCPKPEEIEREEQTREDRLHEWDRQRERTETLREELKARCLERLLTAKPHELAPWPSKQAPYSAVSPDGGDAKDALKVEFLDEAERFRRDSLSSLGPGYTLREMGSRLYAIDAGGRMKPVDRADYVVISLAELIEADKKTPDNQLLQNVNRLHRSWYPNCPDHLLPFRRLPGDETARRPITAAHTVPAPSDQSDRTPETDKEPAAAPTGAGEADGSQRPKALWRYAHMVKELSRQGRADPRSRGCDDDEKVALAIHGILLATKSANTSTNRACAILQKHLPVSKAVAQRLLSLYSAHLLDDIKVAYRRGKGGRHADYEV